MTEKEWEEMNLIPTFEAGEEVVFHQGIPVESLCPRCSHVLNSGSPREDRRVTIRGRASGRIICSACKRMYTIPDEGWYALNITGNLGKWIAAPYTILSPIESE